MPLHAPRLQEFESIYLNDSMVKKVKVHVYASYIQVELVILSMHGTCQVRHIVHIC